MKTLAHDGRHQAPRRESGGVLAAILVLALLGLAIWGAWRLGVMAGDQADWRQRLPDVPTALRNMPNPQPPPLPTQRRPAVAPELRQPAG